MPAYFSGCSNTFQTLKKNIISVSIVVAMGRKYLIAAIAVVVLASLSEAQQQCPSACPAASKTSPCKLDVNRNKTATCGTCQETSCLKAVAFFCTKDGRLDLNCTSDSDLSAFRNASACWTWIQSQVRSFSAFSFHHYNSFFLKQCNNNTLNVTVTTAAPPVNVTTTVAASVNGTTTAAARNLAPSAAATTTVASAQKAQKQPNCAQSASFTSASIVVSLTVSILTAVCKC